MFVTVVPRVLSAGLLCLSLAAAGEERREEYIHAVTRGAALLPWQEKAPSAEELAFRAEMEARKDQLLQHRTTPDRPALITPEQMVRARANVESLPWAKDWVNSQAALAEYALEQGPGWIEQMIPVLSAGNAYGFTCPNCVGKASQEGVGSSLIDWNHRDPEYFTCRACGQRYPDAGYPEEGRLQMPRMGQSIHYYRNPAEQADPEDRSGALAWRWVDYPISISFSGIVRENKIGFMRDLAKRTALAYAFTEDIRYAALTRDILVRYATCYRNWLYRDYWGTYADCDPLYAAWHDRRLPLEWKRHPYESAYAKDTPERAAMLQNYWGAGRVHASTDSISGLGALALAYDLTCNVLGEDGKPLWTEEQRQRVERDLLLEYIMGAEPYVGGPGKAESVNNKAPRIYRAMADIAKCLGLPEFAEVALKGYEGIRDHSFLFDGFSEESPSYTEMYLSQLVEIPEALHGFVWPEGYPGREGTVDYYATDPMLRSMYRSLVWTLLPDGSYVPLSDTHVDNSPSAHLLQLGAHRYPDLFAAVPLGIRTARASEFALFNLDAAAPQEAAPLELPELLWPAWQTAILREAGSDGGSVATLAFNPQGGHRHTDNLALFYWHAGRSALGDLGYVGDMPLNRWIRSSLSHNLVVVDDAEQRFNGRKPELACMAATPLATVVEAYSDAYSMCEEYRRRVVMVKIGETPFLIDIFRVRGGSKHAFRTYSEIAASDSEGGSLFFDGLEMPEEPPLPEVGASLAEADIFGLRDVRRAQPQGPWQATWQDDSGAFRLWMVSPCNAVEASNGPGQRKRSETGRRVRYVDAIRTGEALKSVFAAVHEPLSAQWPQIAGVELIENTANATILKITLQDRTLYAIHDAAVPVEVAGIRFAGRFGLFTVSGGTVGSWMSVSATEISLHGQPVVLGDPLWRGAVASVRENALLPETSLVSPPAYAEGVQAYVRVLTDAGWTGLPLDSLSAAALKVKDFTVPPVSAFELPSVHYIASE